MATLVLTAVGTAVGGPIGGAIGAMIGQQVDGALLAPKRRHGPRLGDLSVQTSSYGTQIPKIFGTMRVAGTVIWSTDLQEQRSNSRGGKGQPSTVNYSYSASFAVALSGRPIRAVRRIWADGKLLRGGAGDFKSRTGFRLYHGTESQPVDPLIASAEGGGQAPAHRGVAYAVFEDFQLADYGNRIPSLTFEVEADSNDVAIGEIAEELSGGEIQAGATPALAGYAASGDGVRGAVEALAEALSLSLVERGEALELTSKQSVPLLLEASEHGAKARSSGGRSEFSTQAAGSVPGEVSVAYHDAERDYQAGLQRATRGGHSPRSERMSLPAVLTAGAAKSMAEGRLARLWSGRQSGKLHLSWRRGAIRAGSYLRLEGRAGVWRVTRAGLEHMVVSLELVRVPSTVSAGSVAANAGRALAAPDLIHGPTRLFLFEIPRLDEGLAERPILVAAAAGASSGWRSATLSSSRDKGASWQAEGVTGRQAVVGHAATALAPAGSAMIDTKSSLVVELLNDAMWLQSCNDQALLAGANLAILGRELIQFGVAEPIGEGAFRLSRFLRGRRGTEAAASAHVAGEPFLILEKDKVAVLEPPSGFVGADFWVAAQGVGDGADQVTAKLVIEGAALVPPSPVHLRAQRMQNGDLALSWVRRSRSGWGWLGGSDAPLGEVSEAYRVSLRTGTKERFSNVSQPGYFYTAAQQADDDFEGTVRIEVRQIGTHGASVPALLEIA